MCRVWGLCLSFRGHHLRGPLVEMVVDAEWTSLVRFSSKAECGVFLVAGPGSRVGVQGMRPSSCRPSTALLQSLFHPPEVVLDLA